MTHLRVCSVWLVAGRRNHAQPCSRGELFFAERNKGHRANNLLVGVVSLVLKGFWYPPPVWKILLRPAKVSNLFPSVMVVYTCFFSGVTLEAQKNTKNSDIPWRGAICIHIYEKLWQASAYYPAACDMYPELGSLGTFPSHPHTEGTFTGTLMNARSTLLKQAFSDKLLVFDWISYPRTSERRPLLKGGWCLEILKMDLDPYLMI